MIKVRITKRGIYGAKGQEIPIGTELKITEVPKGWASRVEVLSDDKGKTAVTNPAPIDEPQLPLEAIDAGSGWWAIVDADGKEVGKKLRRDDAEAFNSLSDEDKLAFVKEEA